jgi:ribonuclease HI
VDKLKYPDLLRTCWLLENVFWRLTNYWWCGSGHIIHITNQYVLRIHFPASNNAAEYETCFHGLRIAVDLGIKCLYVHGDLALVINQLNKDWDITSEKIDAYCKEIRKLEGKFYGIEYSHVVQDRNQAADALSKLGSSRAQVPHDVFVQDLLKPSIKQEDDPMVESPWSSLW